jgi:GTP-binding protein HflX
LEVDRREVGRKITKLKQDLEQVRQHRGQQRRQRARAGMPVVALVGYTNAGKSTLLNALTDAGAYVADQLFATLDPTTRRLVLPSNRETVITDTVGFIQRLPTTLVAAFRATLEEIAEADILLHVVDMSHPNVIQQIEAVEDTLAEIEVPAIPRILVWNKSDQYTLSEPPFDVGDLSGYIAQVRISALTGEGITELSLAIESALTATTRLMTLKVPHDRGDLISTLYRNTTVLNREDMEDGVLLTTRVPLDNAAQYEGWQV